MSEESPFKSFSALSKEQIRVNRTETQHSFMKSEHN